MGNLALVLKFIIFYGLIAWTGGKPNTLNVKYLEPGGTFEHTPPKNIGFRHNPFEIYCYRGRPKYLASVFNTIMLQLEIENDDFTQYEGTDPESVKAAYDDHRSIFSFNFLTNNKKKLLKLNPFNQSCIGIESGSTYQVQLNLVRLDLWRVCLFVIGLFVFLFAPVLAENAVFYYLTGVILGISASLLIVVYLVSKLIPRKPMMYGAMIGGWTLSFYFGQMIFDNIRVILVTHHMSVVWYIIASGLISFVICYRMGPPKNERSKNLIRWGLQLAALFMVFYSSHFQEAAVGVNILICLIYYFPRSLIVQGKTLWKRKFPQKRRLLTNEEFHLEGVRETTKALEELRKYCSSPESKPWRTMLKLKDPSRFASFIEGDSHLQDEEILDFETSRTLDLSDDPESDISEDDDDVVGHAPNIDISDDDEDTPPPAVGWAYDRLPSSATHRGRNGSIRTTTTPIQRITPQRNLRTSTPTQRLTPQRNVRNATPTQTNGVGTRKYK